MSLHFKLLSLILLLSLYSCGGSQQRIDMSKFVQEIYTPSYASGFEILSTDSGESILIRIKTPWQGSSEQDERSLLVLRGGEQAPAGYDGAVIEEQAHRVVTMSSSNLAMFEALGEVDRIVGVSALDYISSPRVQEAAKAGKLYDLGYDSSINFELLTLTKADLVLLYSVSGPNNGLVAKLDELGANYLYIGDYAEEHPLGKAEWMVAMGAICGKEREAIKSFEACAHRYNNLCKLTKSVEHKPQVMLNTPYRDVWYMPAMGTYMVRLIEDAGGELSYRENRTTSTQPISIERAYSLVSDCDYWLNIGATTNTLSQLRSSSPKFADMDVVKRGGVYNNTLRSMPNGGSDFWESGVVNPDVVLRDLISIMHPEILSTPLYYYKQLQ